MKMNTTDDNKATIFIRYVPREVKDHFKAYCAKRGITMTDKFIQLMRETIDKGNRIDTR
jgi:hypothetical protein